MISSPAWSDAAVWDEAPDLRPSFAATLRQHSELKLSKTEQKWKRGYPDLSMIYGVRAEGDTVFKTAGFNHSPIPPHPDR
jgi:hypothetical protein